MVNSMRKLVVDNKEIYDLQIKKQKMVEELKKQGAAIDEIKKEMEIKAGKIQGVKDKSIPKMQVVVDGIELKRNLNLECPDCKWEAVDSFQIEDGKLVVYIVDLIAREKEIIQEEIDKLKNEKGTDNNS